MIIEYYRPERIEEVLTLIARPRPKTVPMGGGTFLNRSSRQEYAVVDLQAVGLNQIERQGNTLRVGAVTTLDSLAEYPELDSALRQAILSEGTHNLRQVASLAGTIVSADGRSILVGALLALDAALEIQSQAHGNQTQSLGETLPFRKQALDGKLILALKLPLQVRLGIEYVARTRGDRPIVYAALAQWPSGRTRLALGGYGSAPVLVMDGLESGGLVVAARDAYSQAGDRWASAAYRQEMAGILAARCLDAIASTQSLSIEITQ